jgi:hypothetical protein
VAREGDRRSRPGAFGRVGVATGSAVVRRDGVAVGVGRDLVGELDHVIDPDPLTPRLEAGGTRRIEQCVEEFPLTIVHVQFW